MSTYPVIIWLYTAPNSIARLNLYAYNTGATVLLIADYRPNGKSLATFQVCPSVSGYTFSAPNGTSITIKWDGTFKSSPAPTVSTPFTFFNFTTPGRQPIISYTPASCGSGNTIAVQTLSYPYPSGGSNALIYLFNSIDGGTPQGYLISSQNIKSSSPVSLFPKGYTNPQGELSLYIFWDGNVTNSIPGVSLSPNASSCSQFALATPVTTAIDPTSLPFGGKAAGAPTPQSATTVTCIPTTKFTYSTVAQNDTVIQTYAYPNASGPATPQAILIQYPGTGASNISLCQGSITPYKNLFIKWDGVGLTATSLAVTYNCSQPLIPTSIVASSVTLSTLPQGGTQPVTGTCTSLTPNCSNGGGGGGGSKRAGSWVWWVLGITLFLLLIIGIVFLIIWLRRRHTRAIAV